jgi:hypothetical protein
MEFDLSFIKDAGIGSGPVEVHWDALQGSSFKRVADYTSDFSPADAANGTWQLFGSPRGAPMLGFIELQNTHSGTVEVHWDALQGGSFKRVADYTSDFSPHGAANGTWQLFWSQNGVPTLGFIENWNTHSGTVEVHGDALEGSSFKRVADYTSDFSPADAANGTWQVLGSPTPLITNSGAYDVTWTTATLKGHHQSGGFTYQLPLRVWSNH